MNKEHIKNEFYGKIENKMDEFAHLIYNISRAFPKEEIYGITSQIRRAALSIILNFIEGYARNRTLVFINFLEISFGSLKECKYLLDFSLKENLLTSAQYNESIKLADEIGAMLWHTIKNLKDK